MDTIARMATAEIVVMTAEELGRAEGIIRRGLDTFVEVGNALQEIRDGRGYRLKGYGTFEDYCRGEWQLTRQHVNRMIGASSVVKFLEPVGSIVPETERQARPLTALEPAQQVTAWNYAVETAQRENGGKVTAAIVQRAADEVRERPHVSHNSGNNEWYTPPAYTEAARRVMGGIDLDPASSEVANRTVKARKFYTAQDDGLSKKWAGRVWMNPPYSTGLIGSFVSKLASHFSDGSVSEACVLVNNATETGWFGELVSSAGAVCFLRGRVKYLDENGEPTNTPLQGQAVVYLGGNVSGFSREFSDLGWIAKL